ncbi:MAG: hypothetical protein LQ340_004179, partial [Diploschistes diacapsis]
MEEVKIHSRPFSPEDPKTHQPSARNLEAHPDVTLQDLLTSKDSPTSHDAGVSVGAAEKTLGDMNSPLASQGPHLLPPQKEERTLSMGASGPRTASPHEEALEPLHGKQSSTSNNLLARKLTCCFPPQKLEVYYNISYTVVSLLFLSTFAGYTLAALLSQSIHTHLGQRGAAFLSPLCRIVAYLLLSLHLPWPAIVVGLVICGLGNGITEGAWNAWLGGLENSNELLGILHGTYGLGATIAPVVATRLVSEGKGWYTYYYIVAATNVLEMCVVSLGGFIPSFLLATRSSPTNSSTAPSIFQSGLVATGFWAGLTLGRISLGFLTPRFGERRAISVYLLLAIALQLIFWLVPNFV